MHEKKRWCIIAIIVAISEIILLGIPIALGRCIHEIISGGFIPIFIAHEIYELIHTWKAAYDAYDTIDLITIKRNIQFKYALIDLLVLICYGLMMAGHGDCT